MKLEWFFVSYIKTWFQKSIRSNTEEKKMMSSSGIRGYNKRNSAAVGAHEMQVA